MSALTRYDRRAVELAREFDERRPTITPADLVLLLIPGLLIGGLLAGHLFALSIRTGIVVACLPALVTISYALFYDPPVDDE